MKRNDILKYRAAIEAGSNAVERSDAEALTVKGIYPVWESLIGQTVDKPGFKFTHQGDLYKTIPEKHTFAAEWVPGVGTESLYTRIGRSSCGSGRQVRSHRRHADGWFSAQTALRCPCAGRQLRATRTAKRPRRK